MIDIYREIVQIQEQGRHAALVTIIHTQGSTPRKAGSQMLVRQDGSSRGTISGGRIEAEVTERARQVHETGRPQLYVARLSEEQAGALGLLCGGLLRVWIERV
jgi:xanthine dehydrogenase accessory factor